jgi:hypothetical protein
MPKSVNSVMMGDTGVSFRSADYQASRPSGQAGPRDKAQGVDAAASTVRAGMVFTNVLRFM